jgi:hypothetical protein
MKQRISGFDYPWGNKNQKVVKKDSIEKINISSYKKKGKNLSGIVYKNKPVFDDNIDHKLDRAKDSWQFRDHGRYGSYPEFDDLGDESNP